MRLRKGNFVPRFYESRCDGQVQSLLAPDVGSRFLEKAFRWVRFYDLRITGVNTFAVIKEMGAGSPEFWIPEQREFFGGWCLATVA
jgi:hypothetical protein